MTILRDEDLAFWNDNGYVVIPDAVPQESLDAVVDEVWAFLDMDRNDPDDWYHDPMRKGGEGSRIPAGLLRLSIGFEGAHALIEDLDQALAL